VSNYDRTREAQECEIEILRGLGEHPSTEDMRAMGEQLAWASIADSEERERNAQVGPDEYHPNRSCPCTPGDDWPECATHGVVARRTKEGDE